MAEKRMFSKQIIDSDAFLEMPLSAQALYFHLSMRADDDGFVDNPKKIQRMVNASGDDLKLLIAKRYILTFESGVIVIKHWRIHNTLKTDRYKETVYLEEKSMLALKKNKSYTERKDLNEVYIPCENHLEPQWNHNGTTMETQYSIDKNSIDKVKEVSNSRFTPPTLDEVRDYCKERQNYVDSDKFFDFYESKGWMIGKNKMKDWKAAVRNWEKDSKPKSSNNKFNNFTPRHQDYSDIEKKLIGGR